MNEYYTEDDMCELMGLTPKELIDLKLGNMKLEEEILPELMVDSKEEAIQILKRFSDNEI